MAAIDYLYQSGLSVAVAGGKLRVTPAHLITDTLRQYVRDHRDELLTEAANDPPAETLAWLARVARLLECSPEYLLERGFIDRCDLAELSRAHPARVVALIRSNPAWAAPAPKEAATLADRTDQPQHVVNTAATALPEWIAARDQYVTHLSACCDCYAPAERYCVTGIELRQGYNATTKEQEQ